MYILTGMIGIIIYFIKSDRSRGEAVHKELMAKATRLQEDFTKHELADTDKHARLEAKQDETFRRFDDLDKKLDKLLEYLIK